VSCPACGYGCTSDNDDQVDDRAALVDFVDALLAGDRRLARIMAARNFYDSDLAAIDAAITRAPANTKEAIHG
jgi:hypothetical protein